MKLHGEYSTSAGIRQVMVINGMTEIEMAKALRFPISKFEEYLKGKKGFSIDDLHRFEGTFVYMKDRIRW